MKIYAYYNPQNDPVTNGPSIGNLLPVSDYYYPLLHDPSDNTFLYFEDVNGENYVQFFVSKKVYDLKNNRLIVLVTTGHSGMEPEEFRDYVQREWKKDTSGPSLQGRRLAIRLYFDGSGIEDYICKIPYEPSKDTVIVTHDKQTGKDILFIVTGKSLYIKGGKYILDVHVDVADQTVNQVQLENYFDREWATTNSIGLCDELQD
ncbi:MAG TPA: hypothetical protein VN420_04585 [Candidatus Fimivivens sp.]|nr:hypothetical protein [Candidatus Fimivivens sp.]